MLFRVGTLVIAALLLGGCSHAEGTGPRPRPEHAAAVPSVVAPDPSDEPTLGLRRFFNGRGLDGAPLELTVADGVVVESDAAAAEQVDLGGHFVVPAFIDSHVHLAYDPRGPALLAGGIVAAVDLAAPLRFLESPAPNGPQLLQAGPMLTALQGYPTQSWGADGYGWELRGAEDAVTAIDNLEQSGAALIKFAMAGDPALDDTTLRAAVARAHELGLKTVAHALSAAEAERAALAGIDILAHTPTELLPEPVLEQWSTRAVITTLSAFGTSPAAIENLRQLKAHGTTVLYGTDFGNTRFPGIQPSELTALTSAGLDPAAIISAGTTTAAEFWALDDLGNLALGKRASFLVLDADPTLDALTLSRPLAVYIDGVGHGPISN